MGDKKPSNDLNPILSGSPLPYESDPSKEIDPSTYDVDPNTSNIWWEVPGGVVFKQSYWSMLIHHHLKSTLRDTKLKGQLMFTDASLSSSSTDQQQGSTSGPIQFSSAQFNPLLFNVSPSNFPVISTPITTPLASTGNRDPDQYCSDQQHGLDQFSSAQFNPLLFNVSPPNLPIIPTPQMSPLASTGSRELNQFCSDQHGLDQFSRSQFKRLLFNFSPPYLPIITTPEMSPLASTGSRKLDQFCSDHHGLDQFSRSQFNPLLFNVSPPKFPIIPSPEMSPQASTGSRELDQFCSDQHGLDQFSRSQFNPLLFNVSPSNIPIIPTPEMSPLASTGSRELDQFCPDQHGLDQFNRSQFNPLLVNVSPPNFRIISIPELNPTGRMQRSHQPHQHFPALESAHEGRSMFTDHDPKFKPHDSTLAHEGQPAFIPRGPLFKRHVSPFTVPQSVFMAPSNPGLSKDDDRPILPPSMMVTYTEQEQDKLMENSEKYRRLINNTEGFCAGKWKESDLYPIYNGIHRCPINTPVTCRVAEYAVSFLNKEGEEERKIKRIISVNGQLLKRFNYFMTLEASDKKFYEADVYLGLDEQTKELTFIRPAKYYPTLPNNLRHLIGPDADEGRSSCD